MCLFRTDVLEALVAVTQGGLMELLDACHSLVHLDGENFPCFPLRLAKALLWDRVVFIDSLPVLGVPFVGVHFKCLARLEGSLDLVWLFYLLLFCMDQPEGECILV